MLWERAESLNLKIVEKFQVLTNIYVNAIVFVKFHHCSN